MPRIILENGGMDHAVDLEEDEREGGGNNAQDHDEDIASNFHPIDGPGRMHLTEHERNLAINIKEAIASNPEVDPVSDFMCAQLALIDGDDTDTAIERARHLQCFRQEYGILDTAEDAMRCFMDYIALFPEFHLTFTYIPEGGHYVMIYDTKKFHCNELNTEERLRTFLGGSYYSSVAYCPDFEAIRSGCIIVIECEGYDWKKNVDLKTLKKVWSEIATVYPIWFDKMKYFNASTSMTVAQNMIKPFLPIHLRSKLEFGHQCDVRLDSLYMVPTVEAANLRLLRRLQETLNKRYENERTFRL